MRRLTHAVGGSLLDGEKKAGSPLMANRKAGVADGVAETAAGTSPATRVDAAAGSRDSTRSTDPYVRAEARGVGSAIGRKTI
jgi:hypothetical protein